MVLLLFVQTTKLVPDANNIDEWIAMEMFQVILKRLVIIPKFHGLWFHQKGPSSLNDAFLTYYTSSRTIAFNPKSGLL